MTQRFPLTLTQLVYFVECAKTLHMTEASGELHVAQSAVSTAITHLERALGTTLFIRQHSKGLALTRSGELLLRDTLRLFGMLTDTIDTLRADHTSAQGTINIACFHTLSPFVLPQLLSLIQELHPQLSVTVVEGDYEENIAALRSGRVELAINYALSDADDITHTVVGELKPHIIVPTTHRLARRKRVAFAELADEAFVLLDLPGSSDYFLRTLAHAGITTTPKYRSSSYETVRAMVASGLGYSILNQRPQTEETYTGEKTSVLDISDPVPGLRIAVSTLSQLEPSTRSRTVTELVHRVITGATPPAATLRGAS